MSDERKNMGEEQEIALSQAGQTNARRTCTCAQDGDDEGGRDALAVRPCIQVVAAAATISHLCVHMEHVRTTRCVGPQHLRQGVQSQSGQQRRRDRRAERSDIAIFFLLLVAIFFLAQQVRPLLLRTWPEGQKYYSCFSCVTADIFPPPPLATPRV